MKELFNRFYTQIKNERGISDAIFFFIEDFLNDIAEHRKIDIIIKSPCSVFNFNGHKLVKVISFNSKEFGIFEDGSVALISSLTTEDEGVSWNGDDCYYQEYKTEYKILKLIEKSVISDFLIEKDITAENMESIAIDIFSIIN